MGDKDAGNSFSDKRTFLLPSQISLPPSFVSLALSHLISLDTFSTPILRLQNPPLFSNLLWKERYIGCQIHHTIYPMKKSKIKCFSNVKSVLHKNEGYLNENRDRITLWKIYFETVHTQ